MKNNTLLYVGLGVGAYLLLSGSSNPLSSLLSTVTTPGAAPAAGTAATATSIPGVVVLGGTYVLSGAPAPPLSYPTGLWGTVKNGYYTQYEYPAHVAVNPNISVSAYQMTDAEANQYLNNYLDIKQWANTPGIKDNKDHTFTSPLAAARWHWNTYQPGEQRTFLPMMPTFTGTFVAVEQATGVGVNPSTSGSSTINTIATIGLDALKIAGGVIAILGPNDEKLTPNDVYLLATSGAVIKQILPYYYKNNAKLAMSIDAKFDGLIKQYA